MNKTVLDKPVLICLYGFPGSGKSYVARNLANSVNMAHVSADRIRSELFRNPRYDAQENAVVLHLMNYMSEEFLDAGVSVIYDTNAARAGQRRSLRELARHHKADYLLVWLQIDADSAFARIQNRDRRTADDRYAQDHNQDSFNTLTAAMQNPQDEDYMVISGKHAFITQKNSIISRLYHRGLISGETMRSNVAMPELVNLIPNPFSAPASDERSITIR
jgi:predicted kinase